MIEVNHCVYGSPYFVSTMKRSSGIDQCLISFSIQQLAEIGVF